MFVFRRHDVNWDMGNLGRPVGVLSYRAVFMSPLQRLICAIRGHEDYLHFDKNRVYLQCISCGYESPGWTIENRRPVLQFKTRRAATRGPALARKIA